LPDDLIRTFHVLKLSLRRYFLQLTESKARCVSTALLRPYSGSNKALLRLY
jgi:hypothetical protein